MLYRLRVGYFPISIINPVLLISVLFGKDEITDDMLSESFKEDVSHGYETCITNLLTLYDPKSEEDLINVVDAYKYFRKPSGDIFHEILSQLAHQQIVQHPNYVANSFRQVFKAVTNHPFGSKGDLVEFYKKKEPTNKKVIRALKTSISNTMNNAKKNLMSHLHQYIKSLNKQDLALFFRFVTGAGVNARKRNCCSVYNLSSTSADISNFYSST